MGKVATSPLPSRRSHNGTMKGGPQWTPIALQHCPFCQNPPPLTQVVLNAGNTSVRAIAHQMSMKSNHSISAVTERVTGEFMHIMPIMPSGMPFGRHMIAKCMRSHTVATPLQSTNKQMIMMMINNKDGARELELPLTFSAACHPSTWSTGQHLVGPITGKTFGRTACCMLGTVVICGGPWTTCYCHRCCMLQ